MTLKDPAVLLYRKYEPLDIDLRHYSAVEWTTIINVEKLQFVSLSVYNSLTGQSHGGSVNLDNLQFAQLVELRHKADLIYNDPHVSGAAYNGSATLRISVFISTA